MQKLASRNGAKIAKGRVSLWFGIGGSAHRKVKWNPTARPLDFASGIPWVPTRSPFAYSVPFVVKRPFSGLPPRRHQDTVLHHRHHFQHIQTGAPGGVFRKTQGPQAAAVAGFLQKTEGVFLIPGGERTPGMVDVEVSQQPRRPHRILQGKILPRPRQHQGKRAPRMMPPEVGRHRGPVHQGRGHHHPGPCTGPQGACPVRGGLDHGPPRRPPVPLPGGIAPVEPLRGHPAPLPGQKPRWFTVFPGPGFLHRKTGKNPVARMRQDRRQRRGRAQHIEYNRHLCRPRCRNPLFVCGRRGKNRHPTRRGYGRGRTTVETGDCHHSVLS